SRDPCCRRAAPAPRAETSGTHQSFVCQKVLRIALPEDDPIDVVGGIEPDAGGNDTEHDIIAIAEKAHPDDPPLQVDDVANGVARTVRNNAPRPPRRRAYRRRSE